MLDSPNMKITGRFLSRFFLSLEPAGRPSFIPSAFLFASAAFVLSERRIDSCCAIQPKMLKSRSPVPLGASVQLS
jgi:hypothetical protein